MAFAIELTRDALLDLRYLRKHEQQAVLAGIERQLQADAVTETRNRKPLRPNDLSSWQMRLGRFRVFYDVAAGAQVVTVKAIGWKEHNTLFIRGKEFRL